MLQLCFFFVEILKIVVVYIVIVLYVCPIFFATCSPLVCNNKALISDWCFRVYILRLTSNIQLIDIPKLHIKVLTE